MDDHQKNNPPRTMPIQSATFSNPVNAEIRRAAATGIYDIRGGGEAAGTSFRRSAVSGRIHVALSAGRLS